MSNCIDDQNNPDNELDKLKTWTDKQITFEAKRGRKGRYEVARKKGRLTGVDFMRDRFGLSDVYPERDMEKIWKKAKIMARLYGYSDKELPRKISRADFDKWWLDPIIDKERPAYDDPVKQVAYRQSDPFDEYIYGTGGVIEDIMATRKDLMEGNTLPNKIILSDLNHLLDIIQQLRYPNPSRASMLINLRKKSGGLR